MLSFAFLALCRHCQTGRHHRDAFSLVYQSDYSVGHGGQIFQSPSQSGGVTRPSQSYYTRGSVRGMARGGKALAQTFRSSGWQRGIGLVCFFVFFVSFLVCLWWFFVVVRFLTPPKLWLCLCAEGLVLLKGSSSSLQPVFLCVKFSLILWGYDLLIKHLCELAQFKLRFS